MPTSYWWVNHSETHAEEIGGGYIWCPHTDAKGHPRHTYTNLTLVEPGDRVISYADRAIQAVGVVEAMHRDAQKPAFAAAGANWGNVGWLVPIEGSPLEEPFQPLPHFGQLQPLMPPPHAPLTSKGLGAQNVYLTEISEVLYGVMIGLIRQTNPIVEEFVQAAAAQQAILNSPINETRKKQLVDARVGQGLFRQRVTVLEARCRVSGTTDARMLVASHVKPWAESTDKERLDGNNGLMLAPHVDKLFDRFLISFQDDGKLITAGEGVRALMKSWGLNSEVLTPALRAAQRPYMAYHRNRLAAEAAKGLWP